MSEKPTPPLAFVDTETTGLDPFLHHAWEIAVILRVDGCDNEFVYRIKPDLAYAEPEALEINRYHERIREPEWRWNERHHVAHKVNALLAGAVLIGSNPGFDAAFLGKLFGRYDLPLQPWHYRPVDVATLAAGYLHGSLDTHAGGDRSIFADGYPTYPLDSSALSRAVGVEPPVGADRHTALGDCRWARDVFDAVTGGGR